MTIPPQTAVQLFAALVLGLLIGSFLNVVIHRGPRLWGLVDGDPRGGLAAPGSYCPACKKPISWTGLVPVVSFLVQRGRCRQCGAPIALRYPIAEALGGVVAVVSVALFGAGWAALAAAVFGWALIALAFIDLETGYLPDAITLPLTAAGIFVNAFMMFIGIGDALIGAAAGYLSFRGIGLAFEKLRGKDGLGQGDAKLLAAIGAWGGWMILPTTVLIGAVATLSYILAAKAFGKKQTMDDPIPFGPGLCLAGFIAFASGQYLFSAL